jgi:hypothetical protein
MAAEQTPGTPETPKAAPAQRPAIGDRMRDAGWTPEDVGEGSHGEARPDEEQAAPPVPAQKKAARAPKKAAQAEPTGDEPTEETETPAPKPAAEEKTDADKLGRLGLIKKLAAEEGLVVEDGKILTKQLAEFRLLKKEQRNQIARAEKDAIGRIENAQKELDDRFKKVQSLEAALKGRDHQGLAKALGYEDWDKLQQEIVAWNSDPHYQELREIKEWKAQQEAEAERAAQQRAQQQQQQQRAEMETKYIGDLSGVMKGSQDPVVAAMAEDPLFVRAVYRIQQENWDGRETVTPEQAVRMSAQGARVTLGEELQALHARLDKAFAKQRADAAPKQPAAPKPKIVGAPKPGPSEPAKFEKRLDRMRHYSDRLSEASERDRKVGSSY